MRLTIEHNADDLSSAMRRSPAVVNAKLNKWVNRTSARAERQSKQEVPVDDGPLQSSIRTDASGTLSATVAPHKDYAPFVHDGTGLYGPRKKLITPTKGKVFATKVNPGFGTPNKGGWYIIGKSIKGQKPNPFMDRAYKKVKPIVDNDARDTLDEIIRSI